MAFLPEESRADAIERQAFFAHTPHTLTSAAALTRRVGRTSGARASPSTAKNTNPASSASLPRFSPTTRVILARSEHHFDDREQFP